LYRRRRHSRYFEGFSRSKKKTHDPKCQVFWNERKEPWLGMYDLCTEEDMMLVYSSFEKRSEEPWANAVRPLDRRRKHSLVALCIREEEKRPMIHRLRSFGRSGRSHGRVFYWIWTEEDIAQLYPTFEKQP
jgi:hypothetical protein